MNGVTALTMSLHPRALFSVIGGVFYGKEINNDTPVYEIYFAECEAVNKNTKEIQEKLNLMPILTAEGATDYGFSE